MRLPSVRVVLRDSLSSGSLRQHGTGELWAEPIPRPYKRAEENARLLYGHFGMAFSLYMQPVRNFNLTELEFFSSSSYMRFSSYMRSVFTLFAIFAHALNSLIVRTGVDCCCPNHSVAVWLVAVPHCRCSDPPAGSGSGNCVDRAPDPTDIAACNRELSKKGGVFTAKYATDAKLNESQRNICASGQCIGP